MIKIIQSQNLTEYLNIILLCHRSMVAFCRHVSLKQNGISDYVRTYNIHIYIYRYALGKQPLFCSILVGCKLQHELSKASFESCYWWSTTLGLVAAGSRGRGRAGFAFEHFQARNQDTSGYPDSQIGIYNVW